MRTLAMLFLLSAAGCEPWSPWLTSADGATTGDLSAGDLSDGSAVGPSPDSSTPRVFDGGDGGVTYKVVFITSELYAGDLGGLVGADAKCQALANKASLQGIFKAWLSDQQDSPANRFTHLEVPYVLVDGTLVAAGWSKFASPVHLSAINKTEKNTAPPNAQGCSAVAGVFSGTKFDGTAVLGRNCNGWRNGGANYGAQWGSFTATSDGWWTDGCSSSGSCDAPSLIYCIQQ